MSQKTTLIAAIAVCSAAGFMAGRISKDPESGSFGDRHAPGSRSASGPSAPKGDRSHLGPRASNRQASGLATASRRSGQSSTSSSDPITSMGLIMTTPNALERTEAWLRFVKGLGPDEIEGVVESFRGKGLARENMTEYSMLLSAWAKHDPLAALDYASENTGSPFARQTILTTWATSDPEAAMAWAKENHEGEEANPWMVGVIRGIASSDPARATELMNAMPYSRERGEALSAVQGHYLKQGPDVARAWALSIEDERLRAGAISRIADNLARTDPQGTADWLLANPGDGATRAMADVMERMAESDTQAAMTYFQNITDESLRSSAFAGLAEQIGEDDIRAAAEFIDANPTLATDDVYEEFVWNARREDPALGASAIGSMQSPDRQNRAYRQYLSHWLRRDYDSAVNWVNQNELPQSVQRSVNNMIERMQNEEQAPGR